MTREDYINEVKSYFDEYNEAFLLDECSFITDYLRRCREKGLIEHEAITQLIHPRVMATYLMADEICLHLRQSNSPDELYRYLLHFIQLKPKKMTLYAVGAFLYLCGWTILLGLGAFLLIHYIQEIGIMFQGALHQLFFSEAILGFAYLILSILSYVLGIYIAHSLFRFTFVSIHWISDQLRSRLYRLKSNTY